MPKSQPQTKLKERMAEKNSVSFAASTKSLATASSSTATESVNPPASNLPTMASSSAAQEVATDNPATTAISPKPSPSSNSPEQRTLTLHSYIGDIFSAPPLTVLIHACNTQGSWGAGIAAAFRTKYPVAYTIYRRHCLISHNPKTNPVPSGTCLLIPPSETKPGAPKHWIACLFTSQKYGKGKDKPDVILRNTGPAVSMMLGQIKEAGEGVADLRMCKINSARFAVPWERTVAVLEGLVVEEGWAGDVEVWDIE